jgi:hypothetical protein
VTERSPGGGAAPRPLPFNEDFVCFGEMAESRTATGSGARFCCRVLRAPFEGSEPFTLPDPFRSAGG